MTYASVDDLFGGIENPVEDVTLPSGRVVRVRSLSRAEALDGGSVRGTAAIERHLLQHGMVEPSLTAEQAAAWQAAPLRSAAAADADAAAAAIMRLSGMGVDATKSGRKGDAAQPDAPVRPLARAKARQNGRPDPGASEQ